jgi:large subunit ribosomal protein L1
MGKIKTRLLGLEDVEKKQKEEQKEKSKQKKATSSKTLKTKPATSDSAEAKTKKTDEKKIKETKKTIAVKKRGKAYQEAKKQIDQKKRYTLEEAIKILKKIKFSKFDETVELHLNVDKTGLKGEVELPHAVGKTLRIKIVDDKFIEEFEKSLSAGKQGKIEFDLLITHPSYMPKLAKFAKILGPRGLMPNPKAGTISPNPEVVAKKFEKGLLRWKTEPKFPLIHQMIGKLSAEDKKLIENAQKFMQSVGRAHILSAFIKSTMSPSLKLNLE